MRWSAVSGGREFYFKIDGAKMLVADNGTNQHPKSQDAGYLARTEFLARYGEIFQELFGADELDRIKSLLGDFSQENKML